MYHRRKCKLWQVMRSHVYVIGSASALNNCKQLHFRRCKWPCCTMHRVKYETLNGHV